MNAWQGVGASGLIQKQRRKVEGFPTLVPFPSLTLTLMNCAHTFKNEIDALDLLSYCTNYAVKLNFPIIISISSLDYGVNSFGASCLYDTHNFYFIAEVY
eukprot:gene5990-4296_t